ncbi:MAG TPA: elongation factor G [Spirochaetia bacterium]|nr:elongation factor G [Spirochaetia bacterium]
MKDFESRQIRNIGLVAHSGAGKTSLVESMLFLTGVTTRLGRVEDGTTTGDYHPEEISRHMTVHAKPVPCIWRDVKLNIVDTPGYSDFIGEVRGVLRVVDSALFVVSAVDGVEVQTEIIWDLTDQGNMPRAVFINKMDRENANFYRVLDELKEKFGATFVPFQLPIGAEASFSGIVDIMAQKAFTFGADGKPREAPVPGDLAGQMAEFREKLLETAAEADDKLLTKYLDGEELTPEEVRNGLQKGLANASYVPVLCGSATRSIGVNALMDVLVDFFPAPQVQDGSRLAALVFKTLTDPYVGKMNFIRVFGGKLKADSALYNSTREKGEKIGQVFFVRGKNQVAATEVPAGDLAVLVKLQDTGTGDTLCEKEKPVTLEGIEFPVPTLTVAMEPKSKGDEDKLGNAVARLLEEDRAVRLEKNVETKETLLTGMGEMHLDILVERLKRKYSVDVVTKTPRVPYRETIRQVVKVEGKHKKQTGGHGQFGHVWLRLEPTAEQFVFGEEIFGGSVPRNYVPAVEKGVREAMADGVLAGYPVTGVKVVLYDGSYHPVDSSEMAFKIAASMAFKKGSLLAKPVLLEPIMNVEVHVPEAVMGDIISDFNTRRGRILGMEAAGKDSVVKAVVPMTELYRYTIDLKSMTQGKGSFTMTFSSYEDVPGRLAEELVKKAKAENEEKK